MFAEICKHLECTRKHDYDHHNKLVCKLELQMVSGKITIAQFANPTRHLGSIFKQASNRSFLYDANEGAQKQKQGSQITVNMNEPISGSNRQ